MAAKMRTACKQAAIDRAHELKRSADQEPDETARCQYLGEAIIAYDIAGAIDRLPTPQD